MPRSSGVSDGGLDEELSPRRLSARMNNEVNERASAEVVDDSSGKQDARESGC